MRRGLRRWGAAIGVATALLGASTPALGYPNPGTVRGYTTIHDPSMLIRPGVTPRYLVFGTHNSTLASNDRTNFIDAGPIFLTAPTWWSADGYFPNATDKDIWAPDASFHNGRYWLYYAVTSGPTNQRHSAIGLATSPTANPGSWTDQGPVFTSEHSNDYNAIDPNLLVDAQGNWWLTFGSYWSGIWQVPLNPQTGKPTVPTTMTQLAQRARQNPVGPSEAGPGIEGAVIFYKSPYYYLFASYDHCCTAPYTYNIRVGRSTQPNGGFQDAGGRSLINPNYDVAPPPADSGTMVLEGHDSILGPGGESVVHDDFVNSHDLLVYHWYDTTAQHTPTLGINFLDFSSGWPVVF